MTDAINFPYILIESDKPQNIIAGDNKTLYINLGQVDISFSSVNFSMYQMTQDDKSLWPLIVNRACTLKDPINGICYITLSGTETSSAGTYRCQISLTNNSETQVSLIFTLNILK